MQKKVLSIIVTLVICLSAMPGVPVIADDSDSITHTVTFVTNGLREVEGEGIAQNDAGDYVMVVEDGATINAPSSPVQEFVTHDYEIDPTIHFWCWITKPMDEITSNDDFTNSRRFIFADDPEGRTATPVTEDITLYGCFFGIYGIEVYDLSSSQRLVGGQITYETLLSDGPVTCRATSGSVLYGTDVSVYTYPDDGYCFLGWSTTMSRDGIFSKNPYYFSTCTTGKVLIFALYEESHEININMHFGTVNNTDEIEPIQISALSGSTFEEVMDSLEYKTAVDNFNKLGYDNNKIALTYNPLNYYSSYKEVDNDSISSSESITEDIDLYYTALLPIESIDVAIDSQIAGKYSKIFPTFTFGNESNIILSTDENGEIEAGWLNHDNHDAFEGTFEAGQKYDAWCTVDSVIGYYFNLDKKAVTISNGNLIEIDGTDYSKTIIIEIEASYLEDYNCVIGDSQTIDVNSGELAIFRFSSSGDDSKTFENMVEYYVDGNVVPKTISIDEGFELRASDASAGSVIITLYPAYLRTLSVGEHTLTVLFKNGQTSSATFTISKQVVTSNATTKPHSISTPAASIPATGENSNNTMVLGICFIILAFTVLKTGIIINYRKKG